MARSYRRDSNGRFSSGGGSARGVKATTLAKRKAAVTTDVALKGRAAGSARSGYVRSQRQAAAAATAVRGKGSKAARKAAGVKAKAAQAARTKAFGSKAAPNKAKAAYKAATSKAREAKMLAGGRTSSKGLGRRQDAGAQRIRSSVKAAQAAAAKVRALEKNRGKSRKRAKK